MLAVTPEIVSEPMRDIPEGLASHDANRTSVAVPPPVQFKVTDPPEAMELGVAVNVTVGPVVPAAVVGETMIDILPRAGMIDSPRPIVDGGVAFGSSVVLA